MTVSTGEVAQSSTTSATPEPALQTPGALLQQERTRRGLSVHQAAEGLHLDPWIVESIESNQFLALGAPVYAKGYLRKYAVLLGLAPDVVVSRYDALTDTPVVPTPVPPVTVPPTRPKWPKYVAWIVVAAIIIGIGVAAFELFMPMLRAKQSNAAVATPVTQSEAPVVVQPAPTTPAMVAESSPPTSQAQVTIPQTTLVDAPAPTQSASDVAPPAPAPESQVSAGASVQLRLEFQGASWAEVHDATGKRLFYDVGQPGRSQVMSGSAPLTVVIGVASAVTVTVNDSPIVVPRRANRDSTRFSVGPNGVVQ